MIKHIVMFRFTDKVNDGNREEIKNIISKSVKTMAESGIEGLIKWRPYLIWLKECPMWDCTANLKVKKHWMLIRPTHSTKGTKLSQRTIAKTG